MIAITPMPPTISAIDEITTNARKMAELTCPTHFERGILTHHVEVAWLVHAQPVPDAHDLLDLGDERLSRSALARRCSNQHALMRLASAPEHLNPELPAIRRFGNDDEIVLSEVEPARGGSLAEHADDGVLDRTDAHLLANRVDPHPTEERLVRRLSENDDVAAAIDLGLGEETSRLKLQEIDVGEFLGGAEDSRAFSCSRRRRTRASA